MIHEVEIPDDVSVIDRAMKKAQMTYATQKTRPMAFRIQQLKNLRQGIKNMTTDLSDALKADLGRD